MLPKGETLSVSSALPTPGDYFSLQFSRRSLETDATFVGEDASALIVPAVKVQFLTCF